MLRQIRLLPTIAVGAILATSLGTAVVTATGAHAGPPQDIGAAYVWDYLWADQPFTRRSDPNPLYWFSSTGQVTTVQRENVGMYTVSLPGFRRPDASDITGIAMVTAYGPTPTTPSGQFVDSQFTLTYVEDGNMLGGRRGTHFHESAYARGMRDHTGVMRSPAEFAFPSDSTVRVATLSTGRYHVTLPVDLRAGHVQVVSAFAPEFRPGKHCRWMGGAPARAPPCCASRPTARPRTSTSISPS